MRIGSNTLGQSKTLNKQNTIKGLIPQQVKNFNPSISDTFNILNAWDPIRGSWTTDGDTVSTSTSSSSYPILTSFDLRSQDITATMSLSSAGAGVVFWLQDQDNWWAGVTYYTQGSESYITGSYENCVPRGFCYGKDANGFPWGCESCSTGYNYGTRTRYNFDDRVSIDPETGLANLMVNGNAEFGSTYNINAGGVSRTGSYDGSYCFVDVGYRGYTGGVYIPVNTGDTYLLSAYFKSVGSLQSAGYAGLQCFDEDFNFIDLRNNGDSGNTTLAAAVNNGDTSITLTDASGWQATGAQYYFKNILFYPANHPKYYTPWGYTRFGFGHPTYPDIYFGTRTGNTLYLSTDGVNNNMTWSFGTLPVGTPVSNGLAGGTYGYYLSCGGFGSSAWIQQH